MDRFYTILIGLFLLVNYPLTAQTAIEQIFDNIEVDLTAETLGDYVDLVDYSQDVIIELDQISIKTEKISFDTADPCVCSILQHEKNGDAMHPSRRLISSFNFSDIETVELAAFSDSKLIEIEFGSELVDMQSYRGRKLEEVVQVSQIQWTSEKQHAQELVEIIERIASACSTIE